jgi:hypothetical protein
MPKHTEDMLTAGNEIAARGEKVDPSDLPCDGLITLGEMASRTSAFGASAKCVRTPLLTPASYARGRKSSGCTLRANLAGGEAGRIRKADRFRGWN